MTPPEDANADEVVARCRATAPDFLFSAYYRQMLKAPLLALPRRGAFNLHGSLLPKYRGRVPVNWAVLHGEQETGATLHVMDIKPDHGDIVEQSAVPILGDDTALEVFQKVTVASEIALARRESPHRGQVLLGLAQDGTNALFQEAGVVVVGQDD